MNLGGMGLDSGWIFEGPRGAVIGHIFFEYRGRWFFVGRLGQLCFFGGRLS